MKTVTKTGEQMARDVAVSLADDVMALEAILTGNTATQEIAQRIIEITADHTEEDGDSPVDTYLAGVLDVEIDGRFTNGGWDVRQVALLVGFGGPTSRIISNGGDDVAVVVNWWNDNANVTVYAPRLAAIIFGLADDLSGAN